MKKIFIIFFIILSLSLVSAIDVNVNVPGTIDGSIAYFSSFDVINNTPQKFLMDWENVGSVGCRVRMRADVYNETEPKPIYTAWSREVQLEPGDHSDLLAYYYPNEGNFTAKIFVYHCNTIRDGPILKFEAFRGESKATIKAQEIPFEITRIRSMEDHIEIGVMAKKNITNLILMPKKYPLGWIFESGASGRINKDEEKTININYAANIWKNETINFDMVDEDGGGGITIPITLKRRTEGLTFEQRIIAVLMIINVVLLIFIVKDKNVGQGTYRNYGT